MEGEALHIHVHAGFYSEPVWSGAALLSFPLK